ncbi:hypothetical protein [Massilia sp. ST3]|uniref:hypothetical protein n=1 Tax=Massilia sp. ST3 TaxID=2824903 RepID=UPI001B83822E|nr:hypothetical protein [Massilia sp. ST3]MBQ5950305.1 hypothetical protein [Massilia sp. ST3]
MNKLLLILLLGCAACTTQAQDPQSPAPAAPAPASKAPSDLLAKIRALTADTTCSDNGQCRSLPVGAVACGGPSDYLPYSTLRTNEKEVRELAERYKAERQAQIVRSGMMSTCRHLPDPGAVCVAGSCQLGAGAAAR